MKWPQIRLALSRGFANGGKIFWALYPGAAHSQTRALPRATDMSPRWGFRFAASPTKEFFTDVSDEQKWI
jgi:hypothetical protein